MSKPAIFTQSDVARVLKGAKQAGLAISTIEIDRTGKIVAHIAEAGHSAAPANDWSERIRAQKERTANVRHRVQGSAR